MHSKWSSSAFFKYTCMDYTYLNKCYSSRQTYAHVFFDSEVDSSASTHTKRSVKPSFCFNLNHVIPTPLNLS
jgi:hypothetical protein